MGAFVLYSGMLKRVAAKLSKISNDLRLLSSGPRGGFAEIHLPQRPGSSIMPGKVNPVIPEALNQIAFRVFGLDTTITFAAEGGQLQLNAFEPVIIWSIHEAVELLLAGIRMLETNCLEGLRSRYRQVSGPFGRKHCIGDGTRSAYRLCTCGRNRQISARTRDRSSHRHCKARAGHPASLQSPCERRCSRRLTSSQLAPCEVAA